MALTTGNTIRTKTIQYSEREVLGPHPDGGYRVSSSDGITEYRTWWDDALCDYRCTCPTRPHLCPHVPVLGRWLMEQRTKRKQYELQPAFGGPRPQIVQPEPVPLKKRLEDLYE